VYVVGILGGRDTGAIASALVSEGDEVILAAPASQRAADIEQVRKDFVAAGAMVQQAASVADAIDLATDLVGQRGAVLVAGSLYTVAEAREHLLGIAGDRSFGLR
jgi:dihydrofolate synthase/folylpolyglutamate synthase